MKHSVNREEQPDTRGAHHTRPFVRNARADNLIGGDRRQISGCLGLGGGWGSAGKGREGAFGDDEAVLYPDLVVVMCVYKFVKTHQTEHLKCVHIIVCKLYVNTVEKRNPGKPS